jgi:hypothetical protein
VIPNLESEHLVITFAAIVDFARLFAVRRTVDLPPAQQGCCALGSMLSFAWDTTRK